MHEFSLAAEIVEIAINAAGSANKKSITGITLQIGVLSGVEKSALYTALESLMENTIMENAFIETETVVGTARCSECLKDFELSDIFTPCPHCKSVFKDVISGKEFNVLSIEAE